MIEASRREYDIDNRRTLNDARAAQASVMNAIMMIHCIEIQSDTDMRPDVT